MQITNPFKLIEAYDFARQVHGKQTRTATPEPYVHHLVRVLSIAHRRNPTEELMHACLLHDTVEDTDVTLDKIEKKFGKRVAYLVDGVTNVETPEMSFDKTKLYSASDREVVLLKLSDRIDNTSDMVDVPQLKKPRKKYLEMNPRYIELGFTNRFDQLASELELLTGLLREEDYEALRDYRKTCIPNCYSFDFSEI